MRINLPEINKGSSWQWRIKAYADAAKTLPVDLTQFEFQFVATNAAGQTVLTLNDVEFVRVSDEERLVTLTPSDTDALPVGELFYELQADKQDGTSESWFKGYVNVVA